MSGHPVRARVADIVAERACGGRRGSGYLVADGWVLTARHVVAGAAKVAVWLGAPPRLGPEGRRGVDLASALLDEGSDLALLPITVGAEAPNPPALLGRLDRDSAAPVPVVAAGCPRFKLRAGPTPGRLLRELHEAHGTVAARSNAKTRTYEMADLTVVPPDDAEPDKHSPWEGMSGAAVWADQRLVGVVGQHHPSEGRDTLTARPLEALLSGPADRSARWREALGPRLPSRPGGLWLVRRSAPGEAEVSLARDVARRLAPPELQDRDQVLVDLDGLLASDERWCWLRGEAFAGKTALLAWLVTHPPPDVALASCFLRSTAGTNTADYALSTLTGQLAALADRVDHQPARFLPEKRVQFAELLPAAARACRERGHRLVLLIDGLDEYDLRDVPLRDWLVGDGDLPADAALLVASRSGVDLDFLVEHPLGAHVLPLAAADVAVELRALAMEEISKALADRSRLEYAVVGLVAVADGGLTPGELRALLGVMGISAFVAEITDTLGASLRRTVTPIPDSVSRAVYAFSHAALKDAARVKFADELTEFDATLLGWCDGFRAAGWPDVTAGYVLSNYPRHLQAAGRSDDLIRLLEDRAWYLRHEAFDPSAVMYLAGVQTAWQAAEELDEDGVRAGMLADRLPAEIRACLTVASVTSLSARISPQLIRALVGSGVWSTQRAFRVARVAPAAEERAELLVALAAEGQDDDLLNDVVQTAITATIGIVDEMSCAWMWEKLAPLVPEALLDDALRFAGCLPPQLPDKRRPRAVAEAALLGRAAAAGLPDRALDAVRAMANYTDRTRVLIEVAGALPADLTDEALVLARDLFRDCDEAEPLAALAAATVGSRADGEALLREAFDATLGLPSAEDRSWVLRRRLAPVLPEAWMREALDAARRLDMGRRSTCLTALAARLGVLGQWPAALEVARELQQDPVWRVRGLVAVAPYVPEPERAPLAEEMLEAARAVKVLLLTGELAGAAPHLTKPVLRRALEWVDSGEPEAGTKVARGLLPRLADLGHAEEAYDRALAGQEVGRGQKVGRHGDRIPGVDAWANLIPHLPEPLRAQACREAIHLASRIDDVQERLLTSVALAGALGGEAVRVLLRSLEAMDRSARGNALCRLVPHVPAFLLPEAVAMALTVDAVARFGGTSLWSPRAGALAALAPRLKGPLRERALEAARAAVAEVDDVDQRNEATLRVAAAFDASDVATADVREAVTRRIRSAGPSRWRDELVLACRPFLADDLVEQVGGEQQVADARHAERVDALLDHDARPGARELEAATLRAALNAALAIAAQELRAAALSRLAPHLMVILGLTDADGTEYHWDRNRMQVLEALAPHLSHDQLPDALDATLALITRQSYGSEKVLASLAGALATLPRDRLLPLWGRTLHAVATLHRTKTLRHLGNLAPVVTTLGEQVAARELVRAVRETGKWWP